MSKPSKFPLIYRILASFILGILLGLAAERWSSPTALDTILTIVMPFGNVLVAMLKMVVYPIIFFSLVLGAASLPMKKSGKVGAVVILWYFATSLFATLFGVGLAYLMNPSIQAADSLAGNYMKGAQALSGNAGASTVSDFFVGLFQNPFQALASGQFLPIIIFAIAFGLAARCILDRPQSQDTALVQKMIEVFDGIQKTAFQLVEWVMLYFPFGIFALTFSNFASHGTLLFGPYLRIVLCVMLGVAAMILLIYPLALLLFCRENPYRILLRIRQALITAFVTRSSAATLPVSFNAMRQLGVDRSLSSFSLPLGATVNMDGVCVHLPVFVILAANLFHMHLTALQLAILVTSILFASVGAGGVPGGSVFLLFMVLENLGLSPEQVATIVALALGINPILDMFETCCNVAGDNICTYIVARRNGLCHDTPTAP